jgi:deoxyribose-phosphate aldolase
VGARPHREVLSPSEIARRFDGNLLDPTLSDDDLIRGCHHAVELGLASVICRPARAAVAASAVEGSDVPVCTGLNVRDDAWFDASPLDITIAADEAVQDGVRDLALFVAPTQLEPDRHEALSERVLAVVASAAACGGAARVVLMTSGMTPKQISDGCRISVRCGAHMVQGGCATTGDRASLSQIAVMREELGGAALLKWMAPVRSLDWFLVARAEGVDRFWGDVDKVLDQARERQSWGERIRVPLVGVDY